MNKSINKLRGAVGDLILKGQTHLYDNYSNGAPRFGYNTASSTGRVSLASRSGGSAAAADSQPGTTSRKMVSGSPARRSADATHSRFRESDRSATSAWYAASYLERGLGKSAA